jgi:hypothetical protein
MTLPITLLDLLAWMVLAGVGIFAISLVIFLMIAGISAWRNR